MSQKQKRILTAGILVKEVTWTRAAASEPPRIRAAKRKASSEAQQRMNAKYSWQKLEERIAANFAPGDLVVTLTYDDDHLPADRVHADRKLKKFWEAFRESRKARGESAVYIYNTENVSGAGRWHHHLVVNATGTDDFAEILRCWTCGDDIEIKRLQVDREKNYESLARYMCKERQERGKHTWRCSRNCKKPEVESFRVSEDTEIAAPEGAIVLEDVQVKTEYGSWHYLKYLAVDPQQLPRPKTRRRRRRT